jgi:hypothetical protein
MSPPWAPLLAEKGDGGNAEGADMGIDGTDAVGKGWPDADDRDAEEDNGGPNARLENEARSGAVMVPTGGPADAELGVGREAKDVHSSSSSSWADWAGWAGWMGCAGSGGGNADSVA